ncbi:MAG: Crp/Fnr family transcriptional regulator [Bacteroidota bacterium]
MSNFKDLLLLDPEARIKKYSKGAILHKKGEITQRAFYVNQGLLRSYIIDSKGKEHIFMFASEGWIIADIESQEFEQASELYIDCLEDSEVVVFDRNRLFTSSTKANKVEDHFKLLYRRMGVLQRRVLMLMSAPAPDRYKYFLDAYPDLPNRIPQHMIAAYLGITPQALSTIRRKLSQE